MVFDTTKKRTILYLILIVATLLLSFVQIPLFTDGANLAISPCLITLLLIAYLVGPVRAFIAAVIMAVFGLVSGFTHPSIYSVIMVIVADGLFVLFAGFCFNLMRKSKIQILVNITITSVLSLIFATVISTIASVIVMPFSMNLTFDVYGTLFLDTFLPFFILSKAITVLVTAILYGIYDINTK